MVSVFSFVDKKCRITQINNENENKLTIFSQMDQKQLLCHLW